MANDILYDLTPWEDAPSTLTPINAENLNARDRLLKKVVDKTNELSGQIADKQPIGNYALKSEIPSVPVKSVNGKTGAVVLSASDVGATTQAYVDAEIADLEIRTKQLHLLTTGKDTQEEAEAWLNTNGDKTKIYLMPNGFFWSCREVTVDTGPTYTNRIPKAINSSGTVYNDTGYKNGYRLNSSATEKQQDGCGHTGFISGAKAGDTIRIKNINACTVGYGYMHYFTDAFSQVAGKSYNITANDFKLDSNGVGTYTIPSDVPFVYFRLSYGTMSADSILTINEEIVEGGGTAIELRWASTGYALISTDYGNEIARLVRVTDTHSADIVALKDAVQNCGSDNSGENETLMFISPTGNDSNDGLTANTPKKTVKACVNSGATRISAKRGVYNEFIQLFNIGELEIFPTDNDLTYAVGVEREPVVFDTSDMVAVLSLASYNSIKRVAYSNVNNTQFDKVFTKKSLSPVVGEYGSRYNATIWLLSNDNKTVCIKLKPVLTVAECEAETNTFTYVGGYIYINANWTGVDKIIVPTNWESGITIWGAEKVILREVEVRFSGTYNIDLKNCAFFDLYKCACNYTSYGSGFHPINSNGVMKYCYATKNYDGYGISGYGHTTYIDCIAEFNFDDGMSHHDGTSGTVIGGRFEGNGKGGITPAYGAKVNIYGGLYKDNASFGIGYLYASGLEPASGMVQGATIVGNTLGITVGENCDVTMLSCVLKDNTTEREIKGNLTEYGTIK